MRKKSCKSRTLLKLLSCMRYKPSDPLDLELTDAANEVVEEELQDTNITESALGPF